MSDSVKNFIQEIVADPAKLGQFLSDPDAALSDFEESDKAKIKAIVGHQVAAKLAESHAPESYAMLM